MRRLLITSTVLILLAAWASGQPGNTGTLASEQLKLFQPNRELLENLVAHSVELASATSPVARVKACHEAAKDLGKALKDASELDDADRVAELSEHLTAVIRHGLVPTIDEAQRTITVTNADDLFRATREANIDVERYVQSISAIGKTGTSSRVRSAREELNAARELLSERHRSK